MKNSSLNLITKNLIFVTGLTRSGKTAIAPLISSMKNCEQFFFNTFAENVTISNFLKLIDDNISQNLISRALNEEIYNKIYGRNLNNKKNDITNIKLYRGSIDYKKRTLLKKSDSSTKKILKKNYFPILYHEALINLKLIEKVIKNPKIINVSRHPVDIVNSWKLNDYVDEYFKSPKSTAITINYKNQILPFFLKGVESKVKFCKSKEDKIVLMQCNLINIFKQNYKISNNNNIMLIKFDDFLLDTNKSLKNICNKFNLEFSDKINIALKDQNCPRKIDYSNRLKTKKRILKNLSPKFIDIFEKMIYEYESNLIFF